MSTQIKKYNFKAGLPVEFEIIDMQTLFKTHMDLVTSIHRTGFYHVLWFQKGNPKHLIDFVPVEIKRETILFLSKEIVHCFDKKGNFEGKIIVFTDNFFCRTENDTKFLRGSSLFNDLFTVSQIHPQKHLKQFYELLHLMNNELQNPRDNYQADILQNLLHNFLLLAEREEQTQKSAKIRKDVNLEYVTIFKELLDNNFSTLKHVSSYTKRMQVTEKRLNKATSTVLGKSPKEMIDDRLVLEIKRLLAYTNESVKEIGFTLGFDEPTNFIKYFRKHSNSTPVEFREQFR